ncbi:MAG: MFS transporter [Verrucomicrobia bacterium]|nr:MFS transporter [Verrucomicrobiota bacterium]
MNATIIMVSQAATALGSLVWGSAAAAAGVVARFVAAAGLAIVAMISSRASPTFACRSTSTDLNFEPAPATTFSNNPSRLPESQQGPLSITMEFRVDANRRPDFRFGWQSSTDLPSQWAMAAI